MTRPDTAPLYKKLLMMSLIVMFLKPDSAEEEGDDQTDGLHDCLVSGVPVQVGEVGVEV